MGRGERETICDIVNRYIYMLYIFNDVRYRINSNSSGEFNLLVLLLSEIKNVPIMSLKII